MDEAESKAAGVIAMHIEQLERAVEFASTKMDAALFDACCEVLSSKHKDLHWECEFGKDFDGEQWLAPPEWRAEGEEVGGEYDLYCYLEFGGDDAHTFLAYFAGVQERKVYLSLSTNTVSGKNNLRRLARSVRDILPELTNVGFHFEEAEFVIKVPIRFNREEISRGFGESDLTTALQPLGSALDRINEARSPLDRVVAAIREFNE